MPVPMDVGNVERPWRQEKEEGEWSYIDALAWTRSATIAEELDTSRVSARRRE